MITGSIVNYSILLWIVSGLYLLRVDVVGLALAKLEKEKKTARLTGWFNLITGLALALWKWIT